MAGDSSSRPSYDEREQARERLKASVDALAERANLQVQMQKEPLKMLGGASAVGALLGVVIGRQFRRSKKIYVDAESPERDQKALLKAQRSQKDGGGIGGALVATLTTLAFKTLSDRVITPKLEEFAGGLLDRAGQQSGQQKPGHQPHKPSPGQSQPAGAGQKASGAGSLSGSGARTRPAPASTSATASFLKRDEGGEASDAARSGVPGGPSIPGTGSSVPTPTSTVVAKAQGSPIDPEEKTNPNIR